MKTDIVRLKLRQRLNKASSQKYNSIECYHEREAVNKALLEWTRRQIHGINLTKEGDEETTMRVDDLQILLDSENLSSTKQDLYYKSEIFPKNYGWFKTILVYGKKDKCGEELISDLHHIEEANINDWLNDWSKKPSFEFRQAFYTLSGNTVKVYTNNEFEITKIKLIYYRLPAQFDILDCEHADKSMGLNKDIEFKDDVAELIIDEAAAIIAADIENVLAFEATSKRKEENN